MSGERTRGTVYRGLVDCFREAALASPELDARLLMSAACGVSDVALISDPQAPVAPWAYQRLRHMKERRLAGEPVSRILGTREFWGLEFLLGAETLDPRPDSETLIAAALDHLPDRQAPLRVADFGTGTGCLLLALLSELPNAVGLGIDISEEAVAVAVGNAARLGLTDRSAFQLGNWDEGLEGPFDVILSNPPYIPSRDIEGLAPEVRLYDPLTALDGGGDGLDAYRHLVGTAQRLLTPGGVAVFELGVGQEESVPGLARSAGLMVAGVVNDLGGVPRALVLRSGR